MSSIPEKLKNTNFRFVLIQNGKKFPFEKKWQSENNYPFYHKKLIKHLKLRNGNYGVVCGYGNLLVIDCDTKMLEKTVENNLPDTFKVRTGSGGSHFYFTVDDFYKPIRLLDDGNKNVGDIQWEGKQVVGPTSLHPNSNKYEIENNSNIKNISSEDIKDVLEPWIIKDKKEGDDRVNKDFMENNKNQNGSIYSLSVADVVNLGGMEKIGYEYRGAHPVHGSTTGKNFTINISKNTWHCFRHSCGGGPFQLVAVKEGIIKCHEAGKGCLSKEKFRKVLEVAKKKYNLKVD